MTVLEAGTFALAVLGFCLGVFNTWQAHRRDSVRLKVRPVNVVGIDKRLDFGIDVENLSQFPVDILEVGFVFADGSRAMVMDHILIDGSRLPRKLEPRSELTVYFSATIFSEIARSKVVSAYARVPGKRNFTGTSAALKQHLGS